MELLEKFKRMAVIFILMLFTLFGILIMLGGLFSVFAFKEVIGGVVMMFIGLVFSMITGIPLIIVVKGDIPFFERALFCFTLLLGAGLAVGSIFYTVSSVKYVKSSVPVSAEVVSISTYHDRKGTEKHDVTVSYEYDDVIYKVEINSWTPGMKEGDIITVYHHGDARGEIRDKMELWGVPAIMLAIGICFIYGGIYNLKNSVSDVREDEVYWDER